MVKDEPLLWRERERERERERDGWCSVVVCVFNGIERERKRERKVVDGCCNPFLGPQINKIK